MMTDLVLIEQFDSRTAAEVARSILEANDIPVTFEADDAGEMIPHLAPVRLMVGSADEAEAREILSEAMKSTDEAGEEGVDGEPTA
ncbi:MAG: DUF2007 domain-containing protein [Deltaproteobacteria bacterium]|nr:DUF2007 domain-containing protein [Deltaproteobacteria bacterium]